MANAGRVGIKPEGEYVSGRTYERLSLVTYNDSVFLSKKRTSAIPSNGDNWMFIITTDKAQLDEIARKLDDLIATGAEKLKGNITNQTPILAANTEANEISVKNNGNGAHPTAASISSAIRKALDFRWYNTHWQVGNIRDEGTGSVGFGFAYDKGNGSELKSYIDTTGKYHGGADIADNAKKVNNHTVNADVPANAVFTDTKVGYGISPIPLTLANVNNDYDDEHWNLSRYVFYSTYRDIKLVSGTLYLFNFGEVNNKVNVYINHGINYYQLRKRLSSGGYEVTFGTVKWDPDHYHQDNWSGATGSGLLSPSSYYLTIFTGTTFDIISTM